MEKKCNGCGRKLQATDSEKWGYVTNLDHDYCYRCFRIKNYNDLVVVDEKLDGVQFEKQISDLVLQQKQDVHFFYLLDIFNLNASRIASLERILDHVDTTIVVNKVDLLPKAVKLTKIANYLETLFAKTSLAKAKIIFFSSVKKQGVDQILALVKNFKNNYFIGKTNVGKSSMLNTLLSALNDTPAIVESSFLNTTVDFIKFEYKNTNLIDTPGIVQTNSFAPLLSPKELKSLYFKKEVKQLSFQITGPQTFIYGNLFALSFHLASPRDLHFYVNPDLDLHRTKPENFVNYLANNFSSLKPSLSAETKYIERTVAFDHSLIGKKVDVFVQELGWVSFLLKVGDQVNYLLTENNPDLLVEARRALI